MRRLTPLVPLAFALVVLAACSGGGSEGRRPGSTSTTSTTATSTTSTTRRSTTTTTEDETPSTTVPTPASVPSPGVSFPPVIAALGDSLLHAAIDDLVTELAPVEVQAHTVPGMQVQEGSYGLSEVSEGGPAALVVVLGTNNAWDGFGAADAAALDDLASSIGSMPCVRWVDVATTTRHPTLNEGALELNAELARLAAKSDTLRILPWSASIAAHPEWFAVDGYHHTEAGSEALTAMIVDSLRQCPQTYIDALR